MVPGVVDVLFWIFTPFVKSSLEGSGSLDNQAHEDDDDDDDDLESSLPNT